MVYARPLMKPLALHIKNLHLQIDGKTILESVDLDVACGDFVSIIGPNGAGKTSLLKCITQIHTHTQGSIEVNGQPIQNYSQRELAQQISYVPQAQGRNLPFTVFEFMLMGRYPHLSPFSSVQADDKKLVMDLLETMELDAFSDRSLNTLSGGERQMVFIAAALAQGAKILLLDEPAAFLDYRHQSQVIKRLKQLHEEMEFTIVSVNHDLNTAYMQSSHILALKNGTNHFFDVAEKALEAKRLETLYDTPFLITPHPSGTGIMAIPE